MRLVFAPFLLYFYNLIAINFNLIIPINIGNVIIVGLFGIPGLVFLIFTLFVV